MYESPKQFDLSHHLDTSSLINYSGLNYGCIFLILWDKEGDDQGPSSQMPGDLKR